MNKMVIAVLGGGYSSEWEVSLRSSKNVYDELSREMYEPYLVVVERKKWYVLMDDGRKIDIDRNDLSFVLNEKKINFQYVINILHGTPGENGIVQGYLDLLGIPYLGCDLFTSSVTFDKIACKRLVAECGVPLAKDFVVYKGDKVNTAEIVEKLGLPMFVKPTASGSSFGVTKVKKEEDILKALDYAFTESNVAIIEEAIDGVEVACGIYVTKKAAHLLPPTEIVSDNEFFDYQAKYDGASKEITPARISNETVELLNEYSLKIYNQTRCHGFVRVDYIVKKGVPYMIEINSIPGMSAQSLVPQQLKCAGITVNDMVTEIINY